jgi:glycosyltransferase involved in cell wall biosynthesis
MSFEIISANYNNARFLAKYFDSIINSFDIPTRIIIVDDCSTDNSVDIIKSYSGKINIKLILNDKNIGFANSLNKALNELKEPYFARLDPDDAVYPDRFSTQIKFLQQNPEIDIVGTNVNYVLNGESKKDSDVLIDEIDILTKISKGILPVIHGTIMGKSKVLREFRYKQEFVPAEDYDLFAYAIYSGYRVSNLVDVLTYVTIHENSISNDLKFLTIKKRFSLANKYFKFNKSLVGSYFEYLHQLFYRKYLFNSTFVRYFYLLISASSMPKKSFKKFLKNIL